MTDNKRGLIFTFMSTTLAIFIAAYMVVLVFFYENGETQVPKELITDLTPYRVALYTLLVAVAYIWPRRTSASDAEIELSQSEVNARKQFFAALWWKLILGFFLYEALFAQKLWM